MPTVRARSFTFTINNYDDANVANLDRVLVNQTEVNYAVYGFEVGASGTPHIQGYVSFGNIKSFAAVKRFLVAPTAHLEQARGTATENRTYCIKEGDAHEFGSLPQQRQVHIIVNGATIQVSFNQVVDLTHLD